jgi:glycine cleavage system H protein
MKSCTRVLHSRKFYTVLSMKFSKLFTKSHEWVSVDKGIATVGISEFAQSELGEIVHVEAPQMGGSFRAGDTVGAVESVKTAADIYSPVTGVITEFNHTLSKTPNLMNQQAEAGGWYFKLKINEDEVKQELNGLMNQQQYENFLNQSKH